MDAYLYKIERRITMNDEIRESLDEVIDEEIKRIKTLLDGKEKSEAISNLTELYKLRIEEEKIDCTKMETARQETVAEQEANLRLEQLNSQKFDRIVNTALQAGITIGEWTLYGLAFYAGLKFEELGTIRTPWMRNLIGMITPKKSKR